MTKSKFALQCNVHAICEKADCARFWTFTFADIPNFPEVALRWRRFIQELGRYFKDLHGVRVYELHQSHGIHLHALFNRFLPVRAVRTLAHRCGFGRIHVIRIPKEEAAIYLAKYVGKTKRTGWLKGKRLWATFGNFNRTKVKDIEVDSAFTRAVKICQQEMRVSKLPYMFVQALRSGPCQNPQRLKLACKMWKNSGAYYSDLLQLLNE